MDVILFDLLITGAEMGVPVDSVGLPVLAAWYRRVKDSPRLAAYLASDRRYPSPGKYNTVFIRVYAPSDLQRSLSFSSLFLPP